MASTVTLSSKHQIVIPKEARDALSLAPGDELLVLSKADRVVILPKPRSFARRTAGLHAGLSRGAASYLEDERSDW
jgi:AbrB family looped-hinge helix DNA binding protein